MILDDLFNQAALDKKTNPQLTIEVSVEVTKNQTGGFKSARTNIGSAEGPTVLSYKLGSEGGPPTRVFPPSFTSPSITITAPSALTLGKGNYEVQIAGKSFVPAVDATTNIIYGAAGPVFCTISICSYATILPVP